MKIRIDAAVLQHQIANLLVQYPELAEDDALRADMIEGETEAFEILEELERRRREAAHLIDGLTPDLVAMGLRQKRFERREEAVRLLMFKIMEMAGIKKHEMSLATLSMRNGPVKVVITDETRLTDEYVRIKREPNKIAIKDALENGTRVDGAELSNPVPVLSIRIK
jgi:hypothetical protein